MSHDTDKLIRQLSLVAFLMAERRALTARDVKSNVEGDREMSDQAFARRFYSDRAELLSLGVPLQSQRDEFTGEALTPSARSSTSCRNSSSRTRSSRHSRPPSTSRGEVRIRRAAAPRSPEPRARTTGLQRGADRDRKPRRGARPRLLTGDAGAAGEARNAISKQRTVRFDYWSISRDEESERTLNPYALLNDNGLWYVVGQDLDRERSRFPSPGSCA